MSDTTRHMDMAVRSAAPSRAAREFRRARRHSVLVSVLKIGLPAIGAVILFGGVFVTWLARSLPEGVSVEAASISRDGQIVMRDPKLSGFDKNNRPYTMTADRAIQTLGGGVDLETVIARVAVNESTTADITAAKGHFNQSKQTLRLSDRISVTTSDGMTITLDAADIDLKTGALIGTGPVRIVSATQNIQAGSLDVTGGGATLRFGGRVKMILNPAAGDMQRPRDFSSNETL